MRQLLPSSSSRALVGERSLLAAARRLAFAVLIALLASAAWADVGELEAEVKNTEGKSVGGVAVTLMDASGSEVWSGEANKKGKFKAELDSPAGDYQVRLSADGYAETTITVQVDEGMTTKSTLTILTPPERAGQIFNEGAQALQANQADEALALFEQAVALDPSLPNSYLGLAIVHHSKADWTAAKEAIDKFDSMAPEGVAIPPLIVYETAVQMGDDAMREAARPQLVGSPDGGDAAIVAYNAGVKEFQAEKVEAASEWFEEALTLDPGLRSAHQSLAAIDFNDQKYEEALGHLSTLLEIDPRHIAGLRMTFFSHASLGHAEEAAAGFAAWADRDPKAVSEALEQAEKFFETDQRAEAALLVGSVLKAAPDEPLANYRMGLIQAASGDTAAARASLEKFLELAPDHEEAAAARAMLADL